MDHPLDPARVRSVLEHAADQPWRVQDIGVLACWLDEQHEYRLHVRDHAVAVGDPVVHDHPYDFTSTVVVGELVNTRYVEGPSGGEYVRERYRAGNEDERRTDAVRLVGVAETLRMGDRYHQRAHELHDSRQRPGTVTVLRIETAIADRELTVCRRPGAPWVTSRARAATQDEVHRITAAALARFDAPAGGA